MRLSQNAFLQFYEKDHEPAGLKTGASSWAVLYTDIKQVIPIGCIIQVYNATDPHATLHIQEKSYLSLISWSIFCFRPDVVLPSGATQSIAPKQTTNALQTVQKELHCPGV